MRSRLVTHIKQRNKRTLFGIIILVILLVVFGMKLLTGLSILVEKLKNPNDEAVDAQSVDYIAPPVLNPVPNATKTAQITVSGYSSTNNNTINLYINDELYGKTDTNSDKTFTFDNVNLSQGENEIKAQTENANGKKSDYSQGVKISYINKDPVLEINNPHDGQTFKKDESPIKVGGKTDKGVKVTVNELWTISNDDGTFFYIYNLKDGDNNLKIVARDDAGNKTEKEIKIKVE